MAEVMKSGEDIRAVFRSNYYESLCELVSKEANFTTVTNQLVLMRLLTKSELHCIKSRRNLSGLERGTAVAKTLYDRFDSYHDNPEKYKKYVLKFCQLLEKVDDTKANKLGCHMRDDLLKFSGSNSKSQFSTIYEGYQPQPSDQPQPSGKPRQRMGMVLLSMIGLLTVVLFLSPGAKADFHASWIDAPVNTTITNQNEFSDFDDKPIKGNKDLNLPTLPDIVKEFDYEPGILKEVYSMNTNPRGYCIIINIRKGRPGTDVDVTHLRRVFTKLKFNVTVYTDLTKIEIEQLMRNVEVANHNSLSCFVMFVLAHGGTNNNKAYFTTASNESVAIEFLENSIKKIEGLNGKPKLLFVQACRGAVKDSGVETDGIEEEETYMAVRIPSHSDFITIYATVSGYVAFRKTTEGTRFIKSIVNVFDNEQHISQFNLLKLLTMVKQDVGNQGDRWKQNPVSTDTLRKDLYFGKPPKMKDELDFKETNKDSSFIPSSLKLRTRDLNNVKNELDSVQFPKTKWMDLCLDLGLHINTLKMIEDNNPRDVSKCLDNCLTSWLEGDVISGKGGPSWSSLKGAVKKICPACADEMQG